MRFLCIWNVCNVDVVYVSHPSDSFELGPSDSCGLGLAVLREHLASRAVTHVACERAAVNTLKCVGRESTVCEVMRSGNSAGRSVVYSVLWNGLSTVKYAAVLIQMELHLN